jgi:hypothetical protein
MQRLRLHVGKISAQNGGGVNQALTPLFYVMLVPLLQWMALKQQMSSTG